MTSKRKNGESKDLENLQVEKQIEDRSAPQTAMLNLIEDLRSDKDYIDNILKNMFGSLVVLNLDGVIRTINRATINTTGYTEEELIGKHISMLAAKPEKAIETLHKVQQEGGLHNHEVVYKRKDGDLRMMLINASLMSAAKTRGIVVVGIDITERKKMEAALQKGEEKYRELVENVNSIILRSDTRGRITFFNEFAQNFFGYTEEEIVGKSLLETIVPKTETTGRDLAQMRKDLMLYPEKFKNNENENIRRTGERVWISWTNKAILDQRGNVTEILSVGNDITERKQAEEERKILIQELQQALEERQEALAKVKTLSGLLPICASCKKIRDDSGYWKQIEAYIREHSDATFTHGICPECVKKLYPDFVIDDEE
ncbi:MAG TPA: PAS domain-containing protein [Thermodesulfobacteriota bacterium]|nr:PAS domain-containing protein [Thermodesulfobacteriota bacterium]